MLASMVEANGAQVCFSPEYYGATQHANNVDYGFVTIGGPDEACEKIVQLYQYVRTGKTRFYVTDRKTAELAKYMENAFLATKVVFCNEFARIAEGYGISYAKLRELFIADPRVNPSHTFVYDECPYYDSHCLNKDIPAIVEAASAHGHNPRFLRAVIAENERFKRG
jgi:UDP-glucose 6-dehydrogenase